MVGHRANICPRPQSGRCGQWGSQVDTTADGAAEHDSAPPFLICGGSHLTGAADCRKKYRKPIKQRISPSDTKMTSAPKEAPFSTVNTKKPSAPGKPGQVKTTNKAEARTKVANFNSGDFPSLENAQIKVSGWVGVASVPLSPSPTEVALQWQNAELRRHTEILAKKIQELEAKFARLTEPQAHADHSKPMQQTEPVDLDDRTSVASLLSSDLQSTSGTPLWHAPVMEHCLEQLERMIADMPGKIFECVRTSFRELCQRELSKIVESTTLTVTESVMFMMQGRKRSIQEKSPSLAFPGTRNAMANGDSSSKHSTAGKYSRGLLPGDAVSTA
ncbi:hypothetical protein MRX96_047585 [Rhipicephalus microplus]|uniref:Uncharacterized protein n=1 Tax=Rhipicephalus microplus TaxID=6941 RepID=A0A9J6E4X4_RHIMP|nr:hypothetical protein HPB51_022743 [Rhipicephalus microplus]